MQSHLSLLFPQAGLTDGEVVLREEISVAVEAAVDLDEGVVAAVGDEAEEAPVEAEAAGEVEVEVDAEVEVVVADEVEAGAEAEGIDAGEVGARIATDSTMKVQRHPTPSSFVACLPTSLKAPWLPWYSIGARTAYVSSPIGTLASLVDSVSLTLPTQNKHKVSWHTTLMGYLSMDRLSDWSSRGGVTNAMKIMDTGVSIGYVGSASTVTLPAAKSVSSATLPGVTMQYMSTLTIPPLISPVVPQTESSLFGR